MRRVLCGLVLALGLAGRAEAQWVVNEQMWAQREYDIAPTTYYAQTFRPSLNNIAAFGFYQAGNNWSPLVDKNQPVPATATWRIDLWTGDPSNGGVRLGGEYVTFDPTVDHHVPLLVTLPNPVGVVIGAEYWLTMGEATTDLFATWWSYGSTDPYFSYLNYDRGAAYRGGANATDPYTLMGGDFDFLTLADPNFSTVPEPSTWALLAVGGGVALMARRRKARAAE